MVKSALISLVLFSSTICFGQNAKSDEKNHVTRNVTKGSEEKVKPSLMVDAIGTTQNPVSPDSLQVILYNPDNELQEKKSSSSDKNSSKPH